MNAFACKKGSKDIVYTSKYDVRPVSVTRIGKILPLWPNFTRLFKVYFLANGKNLNLLWQITYAVGQTCIDCCKWAKFEKLSSHLVTLPVTENIIIDFRVLTLVAFVPSPFLMHFQPLKDVCWYQKRSIVGATCLLGKWLILGRKFS